MTRQYLEQQFIDNITSNKDNYYRLAYSYVRNEDDALDIVQESIYKGFSSIHTIKEPGYLKTWFYRIVVNTALDFLKKRKRLVLMDEETILGFGSETQDQYEDIDLHRALENLPDIYRTIIILRYFEDLKLDEIADVLNENVNTIKTRLYKGLRKLKISLED